MNDTTSEIQLLQASLAGDKDAFGTVVRQYQTLVCAVTYSATGDVGASEELAQETFIRVWQNLSQLKDLSSFRIWLCTIARHLGHTLRPGRCQRVAQSVETVRQLPATAPGPEEAVLAKERQAIVWDAVGCIPVKYREPLVLFYRRQRSVSEVATDLDLSEDAVRQRLHRGRQLIKAELSSVVEETLVRSGPGKAFALAVVAALPALITPPASAAVEGVSVPKLPVATGLSGVVLGPILGLLGGILGSWCSIRNTRSLRERRFMIRMTVAVWLLICVLPGVPLTLTLAGFVPRWTVFVGYGVFFVLLLPLILWANTRQQNIRIEEGTCRDRGPVPGEITPQGSRVSLAGGIVGATLWLLILAALVRDWAFFGVILGCDVLALCGLARMSLRLPQWYWSISLVMIGMLMMLTLAVVNLRWNVWMETYRESAAYEAVNDVSLRTVNILIASLYGGFALLAAWRRVRARRER